MQPVREAPTFNYVATLMCELMEQTLLSADAARELWKEVQEPPTLSSACEHPALKIAVEQHTSRFVKK